MTTRRRTALVAVSTVATAALVGALGIGAASPEDQRKAAEPRPPGEPRQTGMDSRATGILRNMSDFMSQQQRFAVHAEGTLEVVLSNGQKLAFPFESDLRVQRPDRLRADRRGAKTDLSLFYDGRELVLYGAIADLYATTPAPPTLDATIDLARDELGLEAPGADLLYSDVYAGLMQDVVAATYLGPETVRGEVCDHLAFRGKEVDFQIWVRTGTTPTPCRYVVTTTGMAAQPQYTVDLIRWDLSPQFEDNVFTFRPPPEAGKIDFLTATEMKNEELKRLKKGPPADPTRGEER